MDKIKVPEQFEIKEDLSDYESKVLLDLKSNNEIYDVIKSLGLTGKEVKKNLGLLLTYYDDAIICQKCPGIDKCPKASTCFSYGITRENGFVTITRGPCKMAREIIKNKSLFLQCDFPESWLGKDLSSVDTSKVRNPLINSLIDIASGEKANWVFVNGKYNSGRSFILSCFATSYANSVNNPVAFCSMPTLVSELKNSAIKTKDKFASKMESLENVPLLVLDDFGNEYISEFCFSEVIFPLISNRFRKGLITCFTSDFTLEEVISMYAAKVNKPRARQLQNILEAAGCKSFELDSVKLY